MMRSVIGKVWHVSNPPGLYELIHPLWVDVSDEARPVLCWRHRRGRSILITSGNDSWRASQRRVGLPACESSKHRGRD
jgi:hypothetical protein